MTSLTARVAKLEAVTRPGPLMCWHWPQDGGRYSVGLELFTLEEFVTRFGGTPEERCAGVIFSLSSDDDDTPILFSSI